MIRKCFSEKDPQLQIEPEDFSEEADSTNLVRERVKGTKLEGNFKKIKGQIINQSENTITVLLKSGKQTIYSKRDVAKLGQGANSAKKKTVKKKSKIQERPAKPEQPFWRESTSSSEMGQIPKTPQIEQQSEEENITQEAAEREENPEQPIQIKESKTEIDEEPERKETMDKQETKKIRIKGNVKWEKGEKTNSKLNKKPKKPIWLGNNIMVTKVEPESSAEERLPRVFEIAPPETK